MRKLNATLAISAAVLAAAAAPTASAAPSANGSAHRAVKVCGAVPAGSARCHAQVVADAAGKPDVTAVPAGYGPADLQAAYQLAALSSSAGAGRTIAIVDAYDDPTAEADLAVYRNAFSLPPCTTANGCFRKVDQDGRNRYPRVNAGWAQETSLDLDMASAICPSCKILLVEAKSASFADLGVAENRAASYNPAAISNSFGGNEFNGEASSEGYFNHPGIPITVSSGDAGYGVSFPASSRFVTAVGGTTLASTGGTFTESAWAGAGSGCSAYIAKPAWQHDLGCARRTVADVSAVADPATGVAVYDSTRYQGSSGWMKFGGTSVAAPVVAGVYALAGHPTATAAGLYAATGGLSDIVGGSNGSCGGSYLCTAVTGYDGPTGLGSPSGANAF